MRTFPSLVAAFRVLARQRRDGSRGGLVESCITMVPMTEGVDPRTGRAIERDYANWTTHPNNPNGAAAE